MYNFFLAKNDYSTIESIMVVSTFINSFLHFFPVSIFAFAFGVKNLTVLFVPLVIERVKYFILLFQIFILNVFL